MNNTANQIAELITTPNPAAPDITHALAELGNGNMQNGLRTMVDFFKADSIASLRQGHIEGCIWGILGTATLFTIAGGIAHIYHNSKVKELEAEGQVILDTLKQSVQPKQVIVEDTVTTVTEPEQDTDSVTTD